MMMHVDTESIDFERLRELRRLQIGFKGWYFESFDPPVLQGQTVRRGSQLTYHIDWVQIERQEYNFRLELVPEGDVERDFYVTADLNDLLNSMKGIELERKLTKTFA